MKLNHKYKWAITVGIVLLVTAVIVTPIIMFAWRLEQGTGEKGYTAQPIYDVPSPTVDQSGNCSCGFKTATTYNAVKQTPEEYILDGNETVVFGDDVTDTWFTITNYVPLNSNITVQGALIHAGLYTLEIKDVVNGQVICPKHTFKINPITYTLSEFAIDNDIYFSGETAKLTATWSHTTANGTVDTKSGSSSETVADFAVSTTYTNGTMKASKDIFYEKYSSSFADSVTYNYSRNPNLFHNNYSIIEKEATYVVLPRATDSKNYYGTLENALNNVSSGTVTALQKVSYDGEDYLSGTDFHHVIDQPVTVKSGVTLLIPYSQGNTSSYEKVSDDNKTFPEHSYGMAEYRKNLITVSNDVTITNYGTITIPAQITGGYGDRIRASCVVGNYSEIKMGDRSVITNNGTINCIGFITSATTFTDFDDETMPSNMPTVDCTANSTINLLFTFFEQRGGTIMTQMASDKKTTPFNRFVIESIGARLKVNYNAKANAKALASTSYMDVEENIDLFGSKDLGNDKYNFIHIDNDSYVEMTYVNATVDGKNIEKNILKTHGNGKIQPIMLKKSIVIVTVDLSTNVLFLPLSYLWQIDLYAHKGSTAEVNAAIQDIRLMPGAQLTVHENVKFTAKNIAVYPALYEEENIIPSTGTQKHFIYPTDVGDAQLIIYGTLTAQGLGGIVQAASDNAKLTIASTSTTTYELNSDNATYKSITLKARGDVWNNHTATVPTKETLLTLTNTEYRGLSSAWEYPKDITINRYTYNVNIIDDSITKSAYTKSGLTIVGDEEILPTTLSRAHYVSYKWYKNSGCTIEPDKTIFPTSTTYNVYAKWTPTTYTIKYQYIFDGVAEKDMSAYSEATFTIEDNPVKHVDLSAVDFGKGYNFIGWFKASTCDLVDDISTTTGANIISSCSKDGNAFVVYGKWAAQAYNLQYMLGTEGAQSAIAGTTGANPTDLAATLPNDDETLTQYKYYLTGWQLLDGEGNVIKTVDPGVAISNVVTEGDSGPYTLKAVWGTKYTLTVNASNGNNVSISETVYLLDTQTNDKFTNLNAKVTADDTDTTVSLYFKNWTDSNGDEVTSLTFADINTPLTITANFDTKYKLNVTGTNDNSDYTIDFADYNEGKPLYLLESQFSEYLADLNNFGKEYDTNVDVDKYFTGLTNSGGTVITSLETNHFDSSKALTLTGTWGVKHAITASVVIDKSVTLLGVVGDGSITISREGEEDIVFSKSGTTSGIKYFNPQETITIKGSVKGYRGLSRVTTSLTITPTNDAFKALSSNNNTEQSGTVYSGKLTGSFTISITDA